MSELVLTGLDGKNPLGLLAALGTLRAIDDNWREGEAKLVWRESGTFHPAIVDGPGRDDLLDLLLEDLASFRDEPAIEGLRYRKGQDGGDSSETAEKGKLAHDLKPLPSVFAEYLTKMVATNHLRSLDYAAAFATDVAVDSNGNTKPTALHFTSGNQEFLTMVKELLLGKERIPGVGREDLEEALFGPWKYDRPLPVLQWDNTSARDYALRASDPSKEKKQGVPGAEWLGFRGLPFFRTVPVRDRVETPGFKGGWKTSTFRWPIWTVPLRPRVIGSLLTSPEVFQVDPGTLSARGIAIVFEAGVRRSDQGGYGSFTPARVSEPRQHTVGRRRRS